jgi:hypothetical protein
MAAWFCQHLPSSYVQLSLYGIEAAQLLVVWLKAFVADTYDHASMHSVHLCDELCTIPSRVCSMRLQGNIHTTFEGCQRSSTHLERDDHHHHHHHPILKEMIG